MPTEQEDRDALIKAFSKSPVNELFDTLTEDKKALRQHLAEHQGCRDNCPKRRDLDYEIGVINMAIQLKSKLSQFRP